MRMTIGKKLVTCFLGMALLVLLSGAVGYIVLNKSAESADAVAKEKAPAQYAVMNAVLAIEKVQKFVVQYTNTTDGLQTLADNLLASLNEFDMWITMVQYGSTSEEFKNSAYGVIYNTKKLEIVVSKGSDQMQNTLKATLKEGADLRQAVTALIESHNKYVSYGVPVAKKNYPLPDFLNLAQIAHLDWLLQLKDAINIETTFTGITDSQQGLLGAWLSSSYQTDNKEINAIIDKFKKQHKKLLELAAAINTKPTSAEKLKAFNRGISASSRIEQYFSALRKLSAAIYQELEAEGKTRHLAMATSAQNINVQLDALISEAALEMNTAMIAADKAKTQGTLFLTAITLAAVLLAMIMGLLMSRYLARRIQVLAEATRKIAEGDLQKTIAAHSVDELGELAQDTNTMITNLRHMIGQILSFSSNLTQSSKALAGISDKLDGNAGDLNSKASEATKATTKLSTSMLNISTIANDSMQRVQSVAQATEEMSATINEIAENTEQARSVTSKAVITVEKASTKMNELSEAAKEIGKVADVIVNIADQTNLLSLNATIEAARAGEAGKGFAVVANEVKELAGQTNRATGDIRQKIAAIQQSSDMTIAEIREIAGVISNINSIVVVIAGAVEEQAVTTRQIAEDISSVSIGIEDMTGSVNSAAEVAESVSHDISAVNGTSNNVQNGSTEIKNSASGLAKLAEELQILVGKFQL